MTRRLARLLLPFAATAALAGMAIAQDGTQQTAQSIQELSLLAQELKNSVSRFRVSAA